MSLLNTPSPSLTSTQIAALRAQEVQRKRARLLALPCIQFDALLSSWEKGVAEIWDDPNPAEVLAALGVNAVELFALSAQAAAFLESLKPGCTAAAMAKVGAFTPHPDGTITLP